MTVPNVFSNGVGNVPDATLVNANFDYLTGSPFLTGGPIIGPGNSTNTIIGGGFKFTTDSSATRYSGIIAFRGSDAAHIDLRFYTIQGDGEGITERMRISYEGNILLGNPAAALATNATDGFAYMQTCAGTPTGVPTSYTGKIAQIYDSTNHARYIYDGAWRSPGEYIESVVSSATNVPGTTGAWGDVTSIALTAGDWDLTGMLFVTRNGATVVGINGEIGISSTSGNSASGLVLGSNRMAVDSNNSGSTFVSYSLTIASYRVNISSPTTYYLKQNIAFSAGTPQSQGRISARRIR